MITYEAIIINRSNKASERRLNLTPEKKSHHDEVPTAIQQYQLFKQRRIQLRKAKNGKQFDKIEEARKKECRNRLRKERSCAEKSQYSGLWLKEEQTDAKLAEMRTDSEKRVTSVNYNSGKKSFQCVQVIAGSFFFLSEKGHVKSLQELTDNLKNLLRQLKNDKAIIRSSLQSNLPIVLSQTKLLEEKDRLRKLCHKEVQKLLKKKNEEPQIKRKKANEDAL